jgi:hypothetical protein
VSHAVSSRLWLNGQTTDYSALSSILNEVGRVDQLADLPIDVGVPDDGLLVGKAMDGKVGLILCSFLEPLR